MKNKNTLKYKLKLSCYNKTKKNLKLEPKINNLNVGFSLYASKKYGETLLQFKKESEKKTGDHCLFDNSSWFGNLNVAKSYKTSDTHIYKWKIKTHTRLLRMDKENEAFINYIFLNTNVILKPLIILTKEQIYKIKYNHPYLKMSNNEKALFEFQFAFGYINIEEQYNFLKFLKYLLENNFIEIETREETSILKKIVFKINYYKLSFFNTKKPKYNRLSFYKFDKYAIMNLCNIFYNKKQYKISGVYQKNTTSFWFPDLIVYKMNIEEYILFNPHHNLVYDKFIE